MIVEIKVPNELVRQIREAISPRSGEYTLLPHSLKLYPSLEAAEYCGVSVQTLNRWRRDGFIDPSEMGAVGSGFIYTEDALTFAMQATNMDRKNTAVEVLGNGN